MAKRHSMREGPLAQLFKATEAAERAEPEDPAKKRPSRAAEPSEPARPTLVDLPDDASAERRIPRPDDQPYAAVIRVIGVGGGG